MAIATNSIFLLLLLFFCVLISTITTTTTAQQTSRNSNNIIPIDSSLMAPTNINTNSLSSWLSRSGRFAFGFYPLQDGSSVVGIWFAGIPQKTVVWTAPLILVKQTDSNNFRLRLTGDQGLILQSTQGQLDQDQSISVISKPVAYASMLDTGNMVLYNSNSKIIWQSFDSPTDTILQGQRLRAGASLFSKASETDYSKGRFRLDMQNDGNLVAYPAERPRPEAGYSYWSTGTFTAGDNVTVNLDEDGRLYLVYTNGTKIKDVSPSDHHVASNRAMFYRLTIDINGTLNIYSYNLQDRNRNWLLKWSEPKNKCAPKGLCGLNAYCTLLDQEVACLCLTGFNFIDSGRQTLGCENEVSIAIDFCESKNTMSTLRETKWEEDTYNVLTSTTEEECKNACLKECSCEVVMFGNTRCRKQKLPLRYGRRVIGSKITVFIKVGTKNSNATLATTSMTPTTDGVIKKSKRSKKELKSTILIAGVSFVSGFLLVIAISGFLVYAHRSSSCYKILPLILKLKERISAKKNRLCAAQ